MVLLVGHSEEIKVDQLTAGRFCQKMVSIFSMQSNSYRVLKCSVSEMGGREL
jgi:hypothetical protein